MPNYKAMYLKMADAMESAIQLLITAQQEAEDIYINSPESEIKLFPSQQAFQPPEESRFEQ